MVGWNWVVLLLKNHYSKLINCWLTTLSLRVIEKWESILAMDPMIKLLLQISFPPFDDETVFYKANCRASNVGGTGIYCVCRIIHSNNKRDVHCFMKQLPDGHFQNFWDSKSVAQRSWTTQNSPISWSRGSYCERVGRVIAICIVGLSYSEDITSFWIKPNV